MSHRSSYLLVAAQRAKQGKLSSCFLCALKGGIPIAGSYGSVDEVSEPSSAVQFYHLSYLHYEYGYYQCLVSLRLILWFAAAEKLSGMVGFSTLQLVRTKTYLIFTRMEMFDSWSWTKRIYSGLMFHWAPEKPETVPPILWMFHSRLCVRLDIGVVGGGFGNL